MNDSLHCHGRVLLSKQNTSAQTLRKLTNRKLHIVQEYGVTLCENDNKRYHLF